MIFLIYWGQSYSIFIGGYSVGKNLLFWKETVSVYGSGRLSRSAIRKPQKMLSSAQKYGGFHLNWD